MMSGVATFLTQKMCVGGIIEEEESAIISYGIEIAVVKAIYFGGTMIVALLFGRALEVACFYLCFSIPRGYAGGCHADSRKVCLLTSATLTALCVAFWSIVPTAVGGYLAMLFVIIAVPVIVALAPVSDHNKPLDEIEQKVYRKKAIVITLAETIIITFMCFQGRNHIALVGATALLVLGIALVVGRWKNELHSND